MFIMFIAANVFNTVTVMTNIEYAYNNQILTCKCDICGNKKHQHLHVTDLDNSFL